jgi:hypothetical protein
MAAIEFTSNPGKTFVLSVKDPLDSYASLATGISSTEVSSTRYRATLTSLTGVVWIEAVDGSTKAVGFANLDSPSANGYSEVTDDLSVASTGVFSGVVVTTEDDPSLANKTVYRGDTIVVSVLYTELDGDNEPIPVSVATDTWVMKISSGTLPKINLGTLSSATGEILLDYLGEVGRVRATRPYTASPLPVGTHDYDLERTTAGGVRTTVVKAKLRVLADA